MLGTDMGTEIETRRLARECAELMDVEPDWYANLVLMALPLDCAYAEHVAKLSLLQSMAAVGALNDLRLPKGWPRGV